MSTKTTKSDASLQEAFLRWEASSRDTIDFKRCYVDVAEDLVAGILLSQIVYWFLPDRKGVSKLTVERDGKLWLAKGREDWWAECRITGRQFDRAIVVLENLGLVTTAVFRFGKSTSKHITVQFTALIERLETMGSPVPVGNYVNVNSRITQTSIQESPEPQFGNDTKVNSGVTESVNPSIEVKSTSESTAERGTEAPPASGPDASNSPAPEVKAMFARIGVIAPAAVVSMAESAMRILAGELKCDPKMALVVIERTAKAAIQAGETVNRFWFEDSKWRGSPTAAPSGATVGMYLGGGPAEVDEPSVSVPDGADQEAGTRLWDGMSKAIKSKIGTGSWDTWVRPFRSGGVLDGVLYLTMPNDAFSVVPDKYEFEEYLPQGIAEIRFLVAEGADVPHESCTVSACGALRTGTGYR